jgi:hypothetical protein
MVDVAALWPSITDDDGTGQSGTVFNKANMETAAVAAINNQVHSATNPTVTPDEVVAARGNMTDLEDRLDGVIDADGVLVPSAQTMSISQVMHTAAAVNFIPDSTFLMWHLGDAAAPTYWTASGSSVARCGTGLGDTKRKVGPYCAKVSSAGSIYHYLIDAAQWAGADHFETQKIGFGVWAWTTTASLGRITVTDGDASTNSSWHTSGAGGGGWEWLSGVHTISAAATYLRVELQVSGAGDVYFSGPTALFSDQAAVRWAPSPKMYGSLVIPYAGAPAVADGVFHYVFARPAIVKDVQAFCGTAPGGADVFTIDIEKDTDGAGTQASIFSAAKEIVTAGAIAGSVQPDGTYANRCFTGFSGAVPAHAIIRLNYDVVGGNTEDTRVYIRCLQWLNPLENFVAYNDFGL